MNGQLAPLYAPALRMKAGELAGVSMLPNDIADSVLPRFIIPPTGERSKDLVLPIALDRVPDFSANLAPVWRNRPALIDPSHILDEFDRERASSWLPIMFRLARQRGVIAVPTATVNDLSDCISAYRASIDRTAFTKIAIVIPSDDLTNPELQAHLNELLEKLDVDAQECIVIAEFTSVEFSDHVVVAPIIRYALESLQECGMWQHIIFQGSNYPEKNPADHSSSTLVARNEWLAWKLAVRFDPSTAEQMIFGDFCADCSKIEFGGKRGKAIRHLRYTVGDWWRVERGPKAGTDRAAMHDVYSRIVSSQHFSGSSFSEADSYIARAARDRSVSHGNGKTWRSLNTAHHITHVVGDIARVKRVTNPSVQPAREAKAEPTASQR